MNPTRASLILAALLCAACGKLAQQTPAAPAAASQSASAHTHDPLAITVDDNLRSRLRLASPSSGVVTDEITVAARVEVDESRITRVGSPIMGRVIMLGAVEGQQIHNGQLLAQLNSTGLSDAQLSLLKALSAKKLAERGVERAKLLVKADVIGTAELQRREAELDQATAELASARDQLTLLGMPAANLRALEESRTINSVSRVLASMEGTVLDRKVTMGQVVQPADTMFEIADLSQVWMVADVPEVEAGHLFVGQSATAEIAAIPGRKFLGKISFVSSTVSEETRTVRVRMDLPNSDKVLKPAMLATMVLRDHPVRRTLIPSAAVVRDGDADYVFIERDATTFVLRPVHLGEQHGAARVLLDGLRSDQQIVTEGAFHLNNERRRRAARGSDGG